MRRREHDRIVRELKLSHAREIQGFRELLDRAMHMNDRPWMPAPADMIEVEEIVEPDPFIEVDELLEVPS